MRKSHKDAISASDLPSHCRTWDDRRRTWVAKARYGTQVEAKTALGPDRKTTAYKCKASSGGEHFHLGRTAGRLG